MRLRPPPGRAGRLWLLRRLAVARRAGDVLEQKRRALHAELARVDAQLVEARREWEEEARAAETWWQRAAVLAGERPLDLARAVPREPAEVRFTWRNALGVVAPADADVDTSQEELFPPGGTSALAYAAESYGRALGAAARLGAAQAAHDRTHAELRATSLRLRAIERRWLPAHEQALAGLELALDEGDREDAVRVRWVSGRRGASILRNPSPPS